MKKIKLSVEVVYFWMLSIYIWRYTIFASLAWNDKYKTITTSISALLKMILVVLLIVFLSVVILSNKRKHYILDFIVILAFYLSSRITNDDTIIWGIVLLLFSKVSSFERIIKIYFKNMLLCFGAIIIFYLTGITCNVMSEVSYRAGNSLGTGHANVIAALCVNLFLAYSYIYLKEKRYIIVLISSMIVGFIWKLTYSKTSVVLLVVFSALVLLYDVMLKTRTQKMMKVLKILVILAIGSSVYLMISGNQISYISDSGFSVRFSQAFIIFQKYGINLFGNNIEFISTIDASRLGIVALILDNAYLRLLLYYGIVPTILFIVIIICILRNVVNKKDYLLLIIACIFIIGGIMEKYILLLNMNFTLLGFANNKLTNKKIGEV